MIEVSPKELLDAIERVRHASAKDYARPILCGIHLVPRDGDLLVRAADNYRMAEVRVPGSVEGEVFESAVVPIEDIRLVTAMLRSFAKGDQRVRISVAAGRVTFDCGITAVTVRVIDGQSPNFDPVFDANAAKEGHLFTVNAKYLKDAMAATKGYWDGVKIVSAGPLEPISVTASGYRELIMPIRVVPSETPKEPK
jgi:DNA polymerase III sliding clamp (beta) subunit (PCNA family)